jgi:nitrile hydratase subunit beta
MSRVNDVGGQTGFGPVVTEENEPVFHADWEARVYALNIALVRRGIYTLDEFRDAIERMPPQAYLAASYYERWLTAIEQLTGEDADGQGEGADADEQGEVSGDD